MTLDLALASVASALLLLVSPWLRGIRAAERLEPGRRPRSRLPMAEVLALVAVGLAPAAVLPLWAALPLGGVAALAAHRRQERRRARERLPAETVAFAVDLLAAAVSAGAPLADALESAVTAVPTAEGLGRAATAIRLGGDVTAALSPGDPARRMARILLRSGEHGVGPGPALRRLASELRREAAAGAAERARRAGVRVVGPLVVCFLPAFVLLAVVPVVLGLVTWSPP